MGKRVSVLLVLLAACSKPPYVVRSTDGGFQVTVPGHWKPRADLHASAEIKMCNPFREQYLIALIVTKFETGRMTIQQHSDATRASIRAAASNFSETGPVALTINGYQAVQYEMRGRVNNIDVVYIHTTIETENHFSQLLAWSLGSKWSANEAVLREVVTSFKKTSP